MAKEWYLMSSPHDQVSGFEDDDFTAMSQEGFLEALETRIASDVEICNFDLTEVIPIRAVIQNRVQDTKLQSLTRHMLAPIGSCKAGMYVKYKDRYWLIINCVDDNSIYEKAVLSICNYQLSWIGEQGDIVQRWCNIASASQYNNGETGMQFYFVRSDQLLVTLPNDDESMLIPDRKRFIIDKRPKIYERQFNDTVKVDTSRSLQTFQLTRAGTVLANYGDSGCVEFIASQDEQHDTDGYYVVNGKGYWLCEVPSQPDNDDKRVVLSCSIETSDQVIYNDLDAGVYKAVFYDSNGNAVSGIKPEWEIKCDFSDRLDITYVDDCIYISANDQKLLNKSFDLILRGTISENIKTEENDNLVDDLDRNMIFSTTGVESKVTVYIRAFL